ncbi:MAG TPA: ADP-ribosylglycohydrolase family protein [Gemmatimonadales bacterium]|nr:ADP-ribosylglycohydrolase family protein [Gemmatimonadales bacterium]
MTLTPADRAAGSLLGLALGDALGFVVEAAPPAEAADYVRAELRQGLAGARARPPFSPGQYSDDTQLARELLLSISESSGFDPAAFATRVARLFTAGRAVGAGPGCRGAAERLAAGTPWERAGAPPPYAGNGAAMRAGPLGTLYGGDPARLVTIARDQALVTHRDQRALAGAVAIAGAVALAARPGPTDPRAFLAELQAWVLPIDESVAQAVAGVSDWLEEGPVRAGARLVRLSGPGAIAGAGVSPFVLPSVAWSLYAFLRSPDDGWETLCTAIEVGGDTDTMAAMAGAMSGARLGPGCWPEPLLDRLTDAGTWGAVDLDRVARECAALERDRGV